MNRTTELRNQLLQRLRTQSWQPGQRLPTERELSDQFALSRSTVRRALAELKEMKLITQTVGSGTFVSEQAPALLSRLPGSRPTAMSTSPADLMVARMALEPAIVEVVVGSATSDDFARMDECCAHGEAAGTFEAFEHWDGMLHEVIAQAAHNSMILGVFRLMNEGRRHDEWGVLKARSLTPERRVAYQREHRELVAALKQRDVGRARVVCQEHLAQVRRNLLGY